MGLLINSHIYRDELLKLNIKTPPTYINDMGNKSIYASYIDGIGSKIILSDNRPSRGENVVDSGVNTRKNNIVKNKLNSANSYLPSLSDNNQNSLYFVRDIEHSGEMSKDILTNSSKNALNKLLLKNLELLDNTIFGEQYTISDLSVVPRQVDNEQSLYTVLKGNRYNSEEKENFATRDKNLNQISGFDKYSSNIKDGRYGEIVLTEYPLDFYLDLDVNSTALLSNFTTDPLEYLLGLDKPLLENETILANLGAISLKFNLEEKLRQRVERSSIINSGFGDVIRRGLSNPEIIRNPYRWVNLFERDSTITTSNTPIDIAADFVSDMLGIENRRWVDFSLSTMYDLTPTCFSEQNRRSSNPLINDVLGRNTSRISDRDVYILNRTGTGQKFYLFYSISRNKYQPDYLANYESGIFQEAQEVVQVFRGLSGFIGIGAGRRPDGLYYLGSKANDPFYLMQDYAGDYIKTNENIIEALKDGKYEEPGYDEVEDYGPNNTKFIWESSKMGVKRREMGINIPDDSILSYNKYINNKFRECSILHRTSQALEKGAFGIEQTLTKFYDGYNLNSKGNAVLTPTKKEILNKKGEVIGYDYSVPGLNFAGKRNNRSINDNGEFCRTWTKVKPYSKIMDLVRYKELIRKERNSVIDRNANYNIFPSELNVNEGMGRRSSQGSFGDAEVEFFGEKRARKYMFSIENLAWRDYKASNYYGVTDLPPCEKGPNGGRIMWFPPYDIQFTDDTSANYTTHQFLGRPEPLYTYNNSERSGTLSWKIIADHPSITHLLVKKELSRLNDNEVDEILSAFWAGCIEFDTFELARLWGVFSQSDIDYFKTVLGEIPKNKNNELIRSDLAKVDGIDTGQSLQSDNTSIVVPTSNINNYSLFFENDVPLNPTTFNKSYTLYDEGIIKGFDEYFEQYRELNQYDGAQNVNHTKLKYGYAVSPDKILYKNTIGSEGDNFFFRSTEVGNNWVGFNHQYFKIEQELLDPKYNNFNLVINLTPKTSPLTDNTPNYNDTLARYRFISVTNWLLNSVLSNTNFTLYDTSDTELTPQHINDILIPFISSGNSLTINRVNNNDQSTTITINLVEDEKKTPKELIKEIFPNAKKITSDNGDDLFFFKTSDYDNDDPCYCFETKDEVKTIIDEQHDLGVPVDRIGALIVNDNNFTDADINCSVLSIVASYNRRVDIELIAEPVEPESTTTVDGETITLAEVETLTPHNVTKREIAQRILNKLITECDYFELLREETPVAFKTLKEKLKYFSPSFHSMTPEGLNSRLTFLQQCLRPGETIKKYNNGNACSDASNTAFGKPPVCVLRIGDFYHTKIIINNLNISYEPLLWDLNPEGIGAQPMLANIQLSFKYIGGSGLRKPVDELQNALSFNFYANTDMYDDRTFANIDKRERDLINLESSYFDNNTLDLIPIVDRVERIVPQDFYTDTPSGTIGNIIDKRKPTAPGGFFDSMILNAVPYDSNTVYNPYNVVSFNDRFFARRFDDKENPTTPNSAFNKTPTNEAYWEEIFWRNFGEQAFSLEFIDSNDPFDGDNIRKRYFNTYEVEYKQIFSELYESYANVVIGNLDLYTKPYNPDVTTNISSDIMLRLLINKNYNKDIAINGGNTLIGIKDQINNFPYQDGFDTSVSFFNGDLTGFKNTYHTFFGMEAFVRGYTEIGDVNSKSDNDEFYNSVVIPTKLHLYPQEALYKIGNGDTLISGDNSGVFSENQRFSGGSLTDTGGLFLKDFTNYNDNVVKILKIVKDELIVKTKLNLNQFWHYTDNNKLFFNKFVSKFETPHRKIVSDYLVNKIEDYYNNVISTVGDIINGDGDNYGVVDNVEKVATIISGLSVILDGYDMTKNDNNLLPFEVIPNGLELDSGNLFGYNPYNNYQKLRSFGGGTITLNEARNITEQRDSSVDNLKNFLSLGNGLYFFRQITDNNIIHDYFSVLSYTKNHSLPKSIQLENGVDTNLNEPNITITNNGVILNSVKDINGADGEVRTSDLNLFEDNYSLKYTFEKLNYEFFDFSNKTLDVMLSDDIMSRSFDIDITYNTEDNLNTQIQNLELYPDPNLHDKIDETKYKLFYYGDNQDLKNTQIEYYKYKIDSVSGTPSEPILNSLNDFIDYTFYISPEYINSIPHVKFTDAVIKSQYNYLGEWESIGTYIINDVVKWGNNFYLKIRNLDLTNTQPDSSNDWTERNDSYNELIQLSGKTIKLSGLIDILFIGALRSVNSSDKEMLMNSLREIQPTKGIIDPNTSAGRRAINRVYSDMSEILDDMFIVINEYIDDCNNITNVLYTNYNNQILNSTQNLNQILLNQNINNKPSVDQIVNNLIKGNVKDYTLLVKDVAKNKFDNKPLINNYLVFNNNRLRFNIINNSDQLERFTGAIGSTDEDNSDVRYDDQYYNNI